MARALVNGVHLYYEDVGEGVPMIFVHEFAGEAASWAPQVRFFARRYRTIAYNARGYPPSDVPDDPAAYSQAQAAEDIRGMLDALRIDRAHVVGLSMGGYASLHFGLMYPQRAHSLVVAGAGYGSKPGERDGFRRDSATIVERLQREGMEKVADTYAIGPTRVQFRDKDPVGWQEFHALLAKQSARGHALTMRGVQMLRPSVYELTDRMAKLDVPTLIMTGDEDEPCLEPSIHMKRTIPTAGPGVMPKARHTIHPPAPHPFTPALLHPP